MEGANAYPETFIGARAAAGKTQQDVANFLGITRAAVGHWETGVSVPEPPSRRLLAQLFNVPLEVIDGWFERAAPASEAA